MNLSELKQLPIADLVNIAQEMGVENTSRMRKQDIIFAMP
jgi:transcription termination factor Rho